MADLSCVLFPNKWLVPNSVRQRGMGGLWECVCLYAVCFLLRPLAVTSVLITLDPEQPQAAWPPPLLQPSSSSPTLSAPHSCSLLIPPSPTFSICNLWCHRSLLSFLRVTRPSIMQTPPRGFDLTGRLAAQPSAPVLWLSLCCAFVALWHPWNRSGEVCAHSPTHTHTHSQAVDELRRSVWVPQSSTGPNYTCL